MSSEAATAGAWNNNRPRCNWTNRDLMGEQVPDDDTFHELWEQWGSNPPLL